MANLVLLTDNVSRIFYQIMLVIDGAVYWLMETAYQTFIVIANVRIFSSATFTEFADRIYALVGVIMLFIIAFQLLSNIVDPDKMNSGEASTGQIVKNIVTTLAIIILLPTVFKYMYKIQDIVLQDNVVGNIILGPSGGSVDVNNGGKMVATYVFSAFINLTGVDDSPDNVCPAYGNKYNFCSAYNKFIDPTSEWYGKVSIFSYKESKEAESSGKETLNTDYRKAIATEIDKGQVEYRFLISTAAGLICAFLFLSFSLDMGVRVAKLAYFQLIAPVPVAFRILPKQKSVFDNWVKSLTSTYLDVFIRLIIVFFCVFLLGRLNEIWNNIFNSSQYGDKSWMVSTLAKIIVIYGIFAFMKEAPKLIAKMFGLEAGDMGFGIKGKLKKAAVFGEGEPLSRENIARLNQNRRLKEGTRPIGRAIDRFGTQWGLGTREENSNITDETELKAIEAQEKALHIAERAERNKDAFDTAKSILDRAKDRVQRADSDIKFDAAADAYKDKFSAPQYAAYSGKSYSELQAIRDDSHSTATEKANASAVMLALEEKGADEYINRTLRDSNAAGYIDDAVMRNSLGKLNDITTTTGAGSEATGKDANGNYKNLYKGKISNADEVKKARNAAQGDNYDTSKGVFVEQRRFAKKKADIAARQNSRRRIQQRKDADAVGKIKPPSGGKSK